MPQNGAPTPLSMVEKYSPLIAATLRFKQTQVTNTLQLLDQGATIPFIARYRKELTGSLDEVGITAIREQQQELVAIDKRREAILNGLTEREQLTDPLHRKLLAATTLTELEDIYLPYKPKRQTRAALAKAKGLAPLAREIWLQPTKKCGIAPYRNPDLGLNTDVEVLAGVRDILAEQIAELQENRNELRQLYRQHAVITTKPVAKNLEQAEKYRDYCNWQELVTKAPSHRLLAIFRAEREKCLTVAIRPEEERGLNILRGRHLVHGPWQDLLTTTIQDSYKRLLAPSLENELRQELKERADKEAIGVFAENLRQLLMAPPLGSKRVLAIDPGYRTGAKVACLDAQGKLLDTATVFPTHGGSRLAEAGERIARLVAEHRIEAIAIGNGTAGRETERFIRQLQLDKNIVVTMVNEDGASIYSASAAARKEFPQLDLTLRGSVSIGRRLQDPLAELVKIEPKSIGVGQYQHDVDQPSLERCLQEVTASCVNSVGVELNTASAELLTYVSGLGPVLAANIVRYRDEAGPFRSREELRQVPRLGAKTFEQCAGFLRIRGGKNPLDNSAVHPERYRLVATMASDAGVSVRELMASAKLRQQLDLRRYMNNAVGSETLADIMAELAKPGRDPREQFQQVEFAEDVQTIDDLQEGMELPAVITNITKFGAFATIGIKQDGLIHVSELADRYVKDPGEVVHLGQQVRVRVIQIDKARGRISLSMRQAAHRTEP